MKRRLIILSILLLSIPMLNINYNHNLNSNNTYDSITKYDYNNVNDI